MLARKKLGIRWAKYPFSRSRLLIPTHAAVFLRPRPCMEATVFALRAASRDQGGQLTLGSSFVMSVWHILGKHNNHNNHNNNNNNNMIISY